eukprot:gene33637-43180_t
MRDLNQVRDKLKVVLMPLGQENQNSVIQKLRDWDLWGPLLVCLLLSIVLSITAPGDTASLVFAAVFVIVWWEHVDGHWFRMEYKRFVTFKPYTHSPAGGACALQSK